MHLLTLIALLYLASVAFFQAGEKRASYPILQNSLTARRSVHALGWLIVVAALAMAAMRNGWEVGIPIWLGAWVLASVLSLFLQALWQRAHVPLAAIGCIIAVIGFVSLPWEKMT